jgi:hypothetical protein
MGGGAHPIGVPGRWIRTVMVHCFTGDETELLFSGCPAAVRHLRRTIKLTADFGLFGSHGGGVCLGQAESHKRLKSEALPAICGKP